MGDQAHLREGGQGTARWTLTRSDDRAAVALTGELDLAAVAGPTDGILGVLRDATAGAALVVLDVHAVSFIDSSGLQLLLRLKQSVEHGGGRFVLSRPSRQVRRVLRVAGVEGFLGITDD